MNLDKKQWQRRGMAQDAGLRLDAYWARELEDEGISRSKVQAWIKAGLATVDQRVVEKPKYKLGLGELLELKGEAVVCCVVPEKLPLDVLYEDEQIAVINKEAGLTTHPAQSQPDGTLVNRLAACYPEICSLDPVRPGIVHRLDKDTSGVMVVARTEKARLALCADFAARKIDKLYLCLAHGVPEDTETDIDLPLGRHPRFKTRMAVVKKGGREAKTKVKVLWHDRDSRMSFLAVSIFTGRTHQVRVHLASLEHPLLGDVSYGSRKHGEWQRKGGLAGNLCVRQMLHAYKLCFDHPETGERLTFTKAPPADFMTLLHACDKQCLRVGITGVAGCGKSSLTAILADLGSPCFSADECVAELYAPGGDGAQMISARFGGKFMLSDTSVDKPALLLAMRGSDALRREVTDMIHPMVRHRMEEFFNAQRDVPVAFAEIPLLLESGFKDDKAVDLSVGVSCPEKLRTGAWREARNVTPEIQAMFDSWQWPSDKKLAACDFVVENNGTLAQLRNAAKKLLAHTAKMHNQRADEFQAYINDILASLA